jgi:hypothetical protein
MDVQGKQGGGKLHSKAKYESDVLHHWVRSVCYNYQQKKGREKQVERHPPLHIRYLFQRHPPSHICSNITHLHISVPTSPTFTYLLQPVLQPEGREATSVVVEHSVRLLPRSPERGLPCTPGCSPCFISCNHVQS